MAVLLDKLKNFFITNSTWNALTKKKFTFPQSIKTDVDPSETWEIVGDIGDGAFGKIFKAKNKESGLLSALKQVNVDDEADLTQYSVEVIILSELKHQNIVGLHEAFYFNSKFWMYLEYCTVGAVDNIIHELEHGLSEPQIQSISKQMCAGLKFLHDNGVIHRDLKAGNVLVTSDATIKLADFGVSAKGAADQKRSTFIGTPYWMAPEVLSCETSADNPYDLRADIWSFGITIIEFAQMDPPYSKMNPGRVSIKIMRGDPPTFDHPKKWSSDLNDFVAKCLQKEPSDRLLASQLLEHRFLRDVESSLPIMQLIGEAGADVTIELCEIDSQDNISSSLSNSNSSDDLLGGSSSLNRSPTTEKPTVSLNKHTVVAEINSERTLPKEHVNGHRESANHTESEDRQSVKKDAKINGHKLDANDKDEVDSKQVVDEEVQELSVSIVDEPDESSPQHHNNKRQADNANMWPVNGFHQGKFGTKPSHRLLHETGAFLHDDNSIAPTPDGPSSDSTFDRTESRYRSFTKIRSYVYEGKVITHKMSRVVVSGDENRQLEEHESRKANFRALKLLQFTENRKLEVMKQRFLFQRDSLERQYEQELKDSLRRYTADCEQLSKDHKQEIEKLEGKQSTEYRILSKNIRDQQERELKAFQDSFKREMKIAKRESSAVPKNLHRRQMEQKEVEFAEMERTYSEHQTEAMKLILDQKSSKHRNEMATLECRLLEEKHQLHRAYEGELWSLEEKKLRLKNELYMQQIKEMFELHKEMTMYRHTQELDQAKRTHDRDLIKLKQKLIADSKEATKKQKMKSRKEQQQLKEQLRTSSVTGEQEREKLRAFESKSKENLKEETQKQEAKNKQALEVFEYEHVAFLTELKQMQSERMADLTEHFNLRIQQENVRNRSEIMDWQFNLSSRKRVLEDEFSWQLAEQRRFYSQVNLPPTSSRPSSHQILPKQETTSSWMNSANHISTAL